MKIQAACKQHVKLAKFYYCQCNVHECFCRDELVSAPTVQHSADPVRVLCLQFLSTYPELCVRHYHRLLYASGESAGTGTSAQVQRGFVQTGKPNCYDKLIK